MICLYRNIWDNHNIDIKKTKQNKLKHAIERGVGFPVGFIKLRLISFFYTYYYLQVFNSNIQRKAG